MKIVKNIDEIPVLKKPVVTLGSFDGVHLGHRAIINRTIDLARKNNSHSVAVTFSPHPQTVLHPERKDFYILNTTEEKIELLESMGIDDLVIIPFTKEFASQPYEQFVRKYIAEKFDTSSLVIGYDHHFGNNREGTIARLTLLAGKYGFRVEEVVAQYVKDTAVSSTKIRKALVTGDIILANTLLGYSYFITGRIVRGDGLGKKLGFPTANIETGDPTKLLPADGSYAVRALISGKQYRGMLNIGNRPTVGGTSRVAEMNIFDFSSDIYNEKIRVHFVEKLREEVKFSSTDELREQLIKDRERSIKILSEEKS